MEEIGGGGTSLSHNYKGGGNMKKRVLILGLLMVLALNPIAMAGANPLASGSRTFNINGRNLSVNVVTVDLNEPGRGLEVVTANDKIGGHEDFSNIIKRKKPRAAINANYFDAYDSLEPMGTIMANGKMEFLDGSPASMVVTKSGRVNIAPHSIDITGYINGQRKDRWNSEKGDMDYFIFKAWLVNKLPQGNSGVYIYTPARGDSIDLKGGLAIEVRKDKVTRIIDRAGKTSIPKDGYIIYYADTDSLREYASQRFKVGDSIELEYNIEEAGDNKKILADKHLLHGSINKETKNHWSANEDEIVYNLFNVWYINTKPIDNKGVYLYTPGKEENLATQGGHLIEVVDGLVTNIAYDVDRIEIPQEGFIIYYGKDAVDKKYIENRFELGYTVDFFDKESLKIDTENIIKKAIEAGAKSQEDNEIKSIISAGPYLVEDGKSIYDPSTSGFQEEKISINRGQRSAVGISKDNKLILVTGSNLNMIELAQVMVELKADRAMNLDGGASSALYANGKTITPAGRKLHTVLLVH